MTRVKMVYRGFDEVSHIWAHKRQDGARCANTFIEGDYYYSYGKHYCIGRHLPDGSVAINREKNSPTTNRHVSEARQATSHLKQYFVYNPGGDLDRDRTLREIAELLDLASRARLKKDHYLAVAQQIADDFNAVCDILKLSKREYKRLVVAETDKELARIRVAQDKLRKNQAAAAKLREQDRLKEAAENVELWRKGQLSWCPSGVGTLLRLGYVNSALHFPGKVLDQTTHVVQTSHGANIPVEDAKKLWPAILLAKLKGKKDYELEMKLGDYQLTKIRADGSIVVGCHDIPFEEINRIAVQLGLEGTYEAAA